MSNLERNDARAIKASINTMQSDSLTLFLAAWFGEKLDYIVAGGVVRVSKWRGKEYFEYYKFMGF